MVGFPSHELYANGSTAESVDFQLLADIKRKARQSGGLS